MVRQSGGRGGGGLDFKDKNQKPSRGSEGMLPQENLEFTTLIVFLRPSDKCKAY